MHNRLHPELLRAILLGVLFVIGVVIFAAGSAVGQPVSLTPAPAPWPATNVRPTSQTAIVRAGPAGPAVRVVTTSQAFGY